MDGRFCHGHFADLGVRRHAKRGNRLTGNVVEAGVARSGVTATAVASGPLIWLPEPGRRTCPYARSIGSAKGLTFSTGFGKVCH